MNVVLCGPRTKRPGTLSHLILFGASLFLPFVLLGQGYFGTVSGELTDPSGAVVAGAKVVLTDQAKGFTYNATSDSAGRYLFTTIHPGLYTVTVNVPGFQTEERTGIKVNVSENATANLKLRVAGASQKIEVSAQAQALTTEDAVTGQVVNLGSSTTCLWSIATCSTS